MAEQEAWKSWQERSVVKNFTLPEDLAEWLRTYAFEQTTPSKRVTQADVVREALADFRERRS